MRRRRHDATQGDAMKITIVPRLGFPLTPRETIGRNDVGAQWCRPLLFPFIEALPLLRSTTLYYAVSG
jgi:hypothetical protein